jgi:hypothetical protein
MEVLKTTEKEIFYMQTVAELHAQLNSERAKLDRMTESSHKANLELEAAGRALENTQASLSREQEAALLAEKAWLPEPAERKLAAARALVDAARNGLSAHRRVVVKQSGIVAGIEAEVMQRQQEAMRIRVAPARAELMEAIQGLVRAAVRASSIGAEFGAVPEIFGHELFPAADPKDSLSDFLERNMQAGLVNSALALQSYMWQRYNKPYVALVAEE